MSVFNVELKKVVDDSYDIEMGYHLEDQLVEDLETGLLGKIRKFADFPFHMMKRLRNLI